MLPIKCDFTGIGGISLVDDAIWITDFGKKGSAIIKYDINSGAIIKVEMPISDRLLAPLRNKNLLYFFPFSNIRKVICLDTYSGKWDLLNEINDLLPHDMGRISAAKVLGDSVVGVFYDSKKWFRIQDKKLVLYDLFIELESFYDELREAKGECINEDKTIDLSLYLSFLDRN